MALLGSLNWIVRHDVLYRWPIPRMEPIRRDPLLAELKQRIREVRQGPDGLLYLLTDEDAGALLRIEPVGPATAAGH